MLDFVRISNFQVKNFESPRGADFTQKFRFRKSQNFTRILIRFHRSFIFGIWHAETSRLRHTFDRMNKVHLWTRWTAQICIVAPYVSVCLKWNVTALKPILRGRSVVVKLHAENCARIAINLILLFRRKRLSDAPAESVPSWSTLQTIQPTKRAVKSF